MSRQNSLTQDGLASPITDRWVTARRPMNERRAPTPAHCGITREVGSKNPAALERLKFKAPVLARYRHRRE